MSSKLAVHDKTTKFKHVFDEADIPLTLEQLKGVMPGRCRQNITPTFVKDLNELIEDPEIRDNFRQNMLGYASVLQDPNISLPAYVQATRYVSYKLLGYSNQESWIKTFPRRYQRMVDKKTSAVDIRATVSCYNRGKTVNQILEQTLVPTYVLNQDLYQKAINVQANLMLNAKSEKVRTEAANSLLGHLKQPETTKVSLDVNLREDSSIRELKQTTLKLIEQQKLMIKSGAMDAQEVAEGKLLTGECRRVN